MQTSPARTESKKPEPEAPEPEAPELEAPPAKPQQSPPGLSATELLKRLTDERSGKIGPDGKKNVKSFNQVRDELELSRRL